LHVTINAIEQTTTFRLNMVTLPSHTSHALHPLDATYFKSFMNAFKKEWDFGMAKHNYFEPNKVTLAK
jgi:heptaprenylglyceryl phosphate synthase